MLYKPDKMDKATHLSFRKFIDAHNQLIIVFCVQMKLMNSHLFDIEFEFLMLAIKVNVISIPHLGGLSVKIIAHVVYDQYY